MINGKRIPWLASCCMCLMLVLCGCVSTTISTKSLGLRKPYQQRVALYFKRMKISTLSMKAGYKKLFKDGFVELYQNIDEVQSLKSYRKQPFELLVIVQFSQTFGNSMKTELIQSITVGAYTKDGKELASIKNRQVYNHLFPATEFEHEDDFNKTFLPVLKKLAITPAVCRYLRQSKPDSRQIVIDDSLNNTTAMPDKTVIDGHEVTITHLDYNSDTRQGIIAINIAGFDALKAREWLVKNIGEICSSKNIVLKSGTEKLKGGHYKILDEKIKNDVLTIKFKAMW